MPAGWVVVEVLEHVADEQRRSEVLHLVDDEPLATSDTTLPHEEHLHRGFELVLGDADDIEILVASCDHLLLLDGLVNARQAVAEAGCALELEH